MAAAAGEQCAALQAELAVAVADQVGVGAQAEAERRQQQVCPGLGGTPGRLGAAIGTMVWAGCRDAF